MFALDNYHIIVYNNIHHFYFEQFNIINERIFLEYSSFVIPNIKVVVLLKTQALICINRIPLLWEYFNSK